MAIREILKYPHEMLRQEAQRVERIDESVKTLIDDMVETMRQAPGVGLAAPQVGVPLRIVVVEYGEGEDEGDEEAEPAEKQLFILVNPEISRLGRAKEVAGEGCLSFPGIVADVERSLSATVVAQDRGGQPLKIKAEGWLARIFQHEIDHLNGVLFTDRAERVYTLEEEPAETSQEDPATSPTPRA